MRNLPKGLVAGTAGCVALACILTSAPGALAATSPGPGTYTVAQATSDRAQLTTIAFDALGFLTGSLASDSFFPPGKVADFWGFQSLRDNDPTGMGHNTDFLTSAALNTLSILTAEQRAQLRSLASTQVVGINQYARDRFVLMTAFRRLLSGDTPAGRPALSRTAVQDVSAALYREDATLSLQRAAVMGQILGGLTAAQRARFDALKGIGMANWPKATEPADLRGLDHDTKVAVMTYAGDLLSWYLGSVDDDVYFCPERHGTYFGSFYLKDAPAVGNPGYAISTSITGDMGRTLLSTLTTRQARLITSLVDQQRTTLSDIVEVRRTVAEQLRRFRNGGSADTQTVMALMSRYGADDGRLSYLYATAFAGVNRTLTVEQRAALTALRSKMIGSIQPAASYLYASPIPAPSVPTTDFLFAPATTKSSA